MSVNLFGLAMKMINASGKVGVIHLENGPTIREVQSLTIVKGQPGLAAASFYDEEGDERAFYFLVKDLIAFESDDIGGTEVDEPEED